MTDNEMLKKSTVKFNTGLYSSKALAEIQSLLAAMKAQFKRMYPMATRTAKYYSLMFARAAADVATGEVIIFWCKDNLASWRSSTEEVFTYSFRNYAIEERMTALAHHIKAIVSDCAGGSKVWRQPDAGDIIVSGCTINLTLARYIYELLLRRSNMSRRYSAEFIKELRGTPIDPIKQQMIAALFEQIKEIHSNADNAVRNAEQERQNAWDAADKIYETTRDEIRNACGKKVAEVKEQLVALVPQFANEDL